jgi:F1F0 ATPase subunit 2
MSEMLVLVMSGGAGFGLGMFFFAGLWWTIRRSFSAQRPALLLLGSMLLRMAIVLAGFYLVSDGDWRRLLLCLLGVIIGRFTLTRFAGPPLQQSPPAAKETGHAP